MCHTEIGHIIPVKNHALVAWSARGQAAVPGSKGSAGRCWGPSVSPLSAYVYS